MQVMHFMVILALLLCCICMCLRLHLCDARPVSASVSASAGARARARTSASSIIPTHIRINHLDSIVHGDDIVVNSPIPSFSWRLSEEDEDEYGDGDDIRSISQTAYQVQILQLHLNGFYLMSDWNADSGKVISSSSTFIPSPISLQPNSRYEFRVRYWSNSGAVSDWAIARFRTAMFDTWRDIPSQWIGSNDLPVHQLKKEFSLPSSSSSSISLVSATIQMSGIGYSNVYVNGQKPDPSRVNDPGWTTYEKRTLYINLAVESFLLPGQVNAVAVELGNGWYSQQQYMNGAQENSYGPPRLWFWMSIVYSDNSTVNIYSNITWIASAGPIVHDGVYMGSIYDKRLERSTWTMAGFNDPFVLWIPVSVLPSPINADGLFALQIHDPIRYPPNNLHVFSTIGSSSDNSLIGADLIGSQGGIIKPINLGWRTEGQILDLGQNIAGWCSFSLVGKRGISFMVRYAETLTLGGNPQVDGSLYSENLRGAASTDIFIFSQDDVLETFEPRFTQHGFRYIEFRGLKNPVDPTQVTCYFIHSETILVGGWNSSNIIMNQIQHNIQWGQLSNMMSLPTDCPQRDERKGWMGDAGLTIDESLYNFDTAAFYVNFLNLIRDVQVDGAVPDTVPLTIGLRPGDPNWQTAYPTIVWSLYDHYGDVGIVADHFQNLKAMVEATRAGWVQTGLKNIWYEYGDWVPPPPFPQTDGHLISSFPFLHDVLIVSRMALLLNDSDTYSAYTALYSQLAVEFHSTFYTSDAIGYADGAQTANALALALPGVVPNKLFPSVLAALVSDVKSKGHLTTGIIGVAQLFPVLSENGYHDLALQLAQSTEYPSYGYMFNNALENATTLWELWDSPSEGPGMNSRNHIMFGSIGAWFYRYVGGIQLNGLNTLTIRPKMAMKKDLMEELQVEVVTIKGSVRVEYHRDASDEGFQAIRMKVRIPPNTEALVQFEPLLVDGRCQRLTESKRIIWKAGVGRIEENLKNGLRGVKEDPDSGMVNISIEAGVYNFFAEWK